RVAIYLEEPDGLVVATERQLEGPHAEVAERLLELALGRYRARGSLSLEHAAEEPSLEAVRGAVEDAGIESVHAVPLVAHDDLIGLLAVYPRRRRVLSEAESELLAALAGQLAVAVPDPAKVEAVRAIFSRPEAASRSAAERALRRGEPHVLDVARAVAVGGAHALLVPFLEAGSTAVIVPIASSERTVQATITLI